MTFSTLRESYIIRFDLFASKNLKALILAAIGDKKQGCYVYLAADNTPLYVGKSTDLVSRLKHQSTPKGIESKMTEKLTEWKYLGVILSNNPHLTEQELIAQLQPTFNILGK